MGKKAVEGRDRRLRWVMVVLASIAGASVFYPGCSPTKVGDDEGAKGGGSGLGSGASNSGGQGGGSGAIGNNGGGPGKGGTDGGFVVEFPDALAEEDAPDAPMGNGDALEECGVYSFKVERTPPELMIVFDRSGSMMRTADGNVPVAGQVSRWTYTRGALNEVIMATEDDISWGMKMYPACKAKDIVGQPLGCEYPIGSGVHNDCAVDGLLADPNLSQYDELLLFTQQNAPAIDRGNTPTAPAIDAALAALQARTTPNPKFMLLATDGEPKCTADPVADSVAAIGRAVAAGIPVFVTGVAISDDPAMTAAHNALNLMAEAGGRARMGTTKYYSALDRAQLAAALAEIAAATISCTFALKDAPPEDALAAVDVDGKRLPEDATNGWSFPTSRKAIIFNGLACQKLKQGEFKDTQVTFGCPGKPLPEPPPPAL